MELLAAKDEEIAAVGMALDNESRALDKAKDQLAAARAEVERLKEAHPYGRPLPNTP